MVTHNLPHYATPFVGRLTEIAEISNRLNDPSCRLLTLVGPGGIGKTRLAVQVALRHFGYFVDGVSFVPLQALNSPDFIVSAIADAVGCEFYSGLDPVQQLLNFFSQKALLLVLDNFEHLSEGAGLLSRIVAEAPQMCVLVTSRERLSLIEEWVFEVRELNYPLSEAETDIEAYDAVQLFVQHARRVKADFALTSIQKPAVIRICRMVGGMPLAIELAAAWVRALSSNEISREIKRSLDILESPTRNVEPRHRTMRMAFEPTWARLTQDERDVFMKLSVFRGGFTRVAAEDVADTSLLTLSALLDKSLIRMDQTGRYDLHELLRQYAAEKLDEVAAEKETVLNQHCAYYVEFLQRLKGDLRNKEEFVAMQSIEKELDNIRMCWDHLIELTDLEGLRKCVETLQVFFRVRDRPYEGEKAFDRAIHVVSQLKPGVERDITLGWLLMGQGKCCARIGQNQHAKELLQASVAILRARNAPRELAWALDELGSILHDRGEYQEAALAHRESLALGEAVGDQSLIAWSYYSLSYTTHVLGSYIEALHLMEKSVALLGQSGDEDGLALAFHALGNHLLQHGEYRRAKEVYEQSMSIYQKLDYQNRLSGVLEGRGRTLFALGDYAEARKQIQQSTAIARELGFPRRLAYSLIRLGDIVHAQGDIDEARRLFSEALSIADKMVDTRQQALAFTGLGHIAFSLGEYKEAYQFYKESLSLNQRIGLPFETAISFSGLGQTANALRDHLEAKMHFRESLSLGLKMQIAPPLLETMVGIARLFSVEGAPARAIELLILSLNHPASHQEMRDRAAHLLNQLEADTSPLLFAAARQRGQTINLEHATIELIAEFSSLDNMPPGHQILSDPLNQRELEVLRLIADGFSNRDIAENLIFSIGTVKWYVHQIHSKLGVNSRTQAIARARELNLL